MKACVTVSVLYCVNKKVFAKAQPSVIVSDEMSEKLSLREEKRQKTIPQKSDG